MSNDNFLATLGAENFRKKVLTVAKEYLSRAWELAGMLYEVKETEIYKAWGFDSFNNYIEDEVGLGRRAVNQYIANFRTFRVQLGVDQTNLKDLEVTKARTIRSVVNSENVEEWIEKAKSSSRRELITEVKRMKDHGDDADTEGIGDVLSSKKMLPVYKQVTFSLDVEQYETWEETRKRLQRICPSDSESWWFDLLCQSFLQEEDNKTFSLQHHLRWLSRVYGVNVLAIDQKVSTAELIDKIQLFFNTIEQTIQDNLFVSAVPKNIPKDRQRDLLMQRFEALANMLGVAGLDDFEFDDSEFEEIEEEDVLIHDDF